MRDPRIKFLRRIPIGETGWIEVEATLHTDDEADTAFVLGLIAILEQHARSRSASAPAPAAPEPR